MKSRTPPDPDRHAPRKRFGQNFLVDAHYVARIVAGIDPRPASGSSRSDPGSAR